MAAFALLLVVGAGWQLSALGRYFETPAGSFAEGQAIDDLIAAEEFHTAIAGVMVLAAIAVGVVFVVWLFRAARNVRRAGATDTLHEGWAIGGWFVPVGMFFLPVTVVSQAWRAADVSPSRPIGTAWKQVRRSGLVIGWWVTFTAGIITNRAAGAAMDPDGSRTVIETAYGLWLAGALLLLTAAVLGAVMVHRLSDRQDRQQAAAARPVQEQLPNPLAASS